MLASSRQRRQVEEEPRSATRRSQRCALVVDGLFHIPLLRGDANPRGSGDARLGKRSEHRARSPGGKSMPDSPSSHLIGSRPILRLLLTSRNRGTSVFAHAAKSARRMPLGTVRGGGSTIVISEAPSTIYIPVSFPPPHLRLDCGELGSYCKAFCASFRFERDCW